MCQAPPCPISKALKGSLRAHRRRPQRFFVVSLTKLNKALIQLLSAAQTMRRDKGDPTWGGEWCLSTRKINKRHTETEVRDPQWNFRNQPAEGGGAGLGRLSCSPNVRRARCCRRVHQTSLILVFLPDLGSGMSSLAHQEEARLPGLFQKSARKGLCLLQGHQRRPTPQPPQSLLSSPVSS